MAVEARDISHISPVVNPWKSHLSFA